MARFWVYTAYIGVWTGVHAVHAVQVYMRLRAGAVAGFGREAGRGWEGRAGIGEYNISYNTYVAVILTYYYEEPIPADKNTRSFQFMLVYAGEQRRARRNRLTWVGLAKPASRARSHAYSGAEEL